MTVRLSTGMRNKMLDGGTTGGVKGALALGFIYLYTGSQPASADTGATGTLLGKVTKDGDGTTGLNFDAAASGVSSKAAAETWRFTGLADGVAGWFRFSAASDTPTATSTTAARIDGTIGTAGADMNIANTNVVTGAVSTVDNFTITQPGA
jgi:hypothetical protein